MESPWRLAGIISEMHAVSSTALVMTACLQPCSLPILWLTVWFSKPGRSLQRGEWEHCRTEVICHGDSEPLFTTAEHTAGG
jgi:hypothetical protein